MGPALVSPHACTFVSWLLHSTHRKRPCFLLFATPLQCYALPQYPRRPNEPALVAIANASALQLPLPQKPRWSLSPVLWALYNVVGHPRQPWDPRDRARQEPPIGARCLATLVDGMISGYDYDYDYVGVCMYVHVCVCKRCTAKRTKELPGERGMHS